MSRRPLAGPQHMPGRHRAAELLGRLQIGTCGACGRARYISRCEARYAARLASPGTRLRAFRCGTFWHLTPSGGRTWLIPHVAAVLDECVVAGAGLQVQEDGPQRQPTSAAQGIMLDDRGRGERACGCPAQARTEPGPATGATCGAGWPAAVPDGGRGATDPLEDARDPGNPHSAHAGGGAG
ncbi:MAG: hypothetical protein JWL97_3716 [Gemmatimonadales bacterium]|nr:hypothetical protein [Gemmatimonadales bacterium]